MRLASLLVHLDEEDLRRLSLEHIQRGTQLPRPQLCSLLETALRDYRFIKQFILNRQPPSFAALALLLDAPEFTLPLEGFVQHATDETRRIADAVDRGDILARDSIGLYRAAFYEARRNDVDLNSSEAQMLTVLRRELRITQVEHFLIEHHHNLREFWDKPDSWVHEENALRSAGLIFIHQDRVLIAEELVPVIRQTPGD